MNPVLYISNKINQKAKTKLKIATFATHESYQEAMAKTGHDFYIIEPPGGKTWEPKYRKLPQNCTLIGSFFEVPYDTDLLLSQERYAQLQNMKSFSNISRIPLIHLDHVEPYGDKTTIEQAKVLQADIHVFISEHNKTTWGNRDGRVIKHGINTDIFSGWVPTKNKMVIYTVNFLKERDVFCGWQEWEQIKAYVNNIDPQIEFKLIGNNPGISETISDPIELCKAINEASCYLNTSKYSPVPMSLLEAMSCGIPVISTRHQEVAKILNDGNSISSNQIGVLGDAIISVCNNQDSHSGIGVQARKFIEQNYSLDSFVSNWNDLFEEARKLKLGTVNEILSI